MRLLSAFLAPLVLTACTSTWSFDAPTEEQRAVARYLCPAEGPVDEAAADARLAALDAYLEARGLTSDGLVLPTTAPEIDLYCALRGNRVAAL